MKNWFKNATILDICPVVLCPTYRYTVVVFICRIPAVTWCVAVIPLIYFTSRYTVIDMSAATGCFRWSAMMYFMFLYSILILLGKRYKHVQWQYKKSHWIYESCMCVTKSRWSRCFGIEHGLFQHCLNNDPVLEQPLTNAKTFEAVLEQPMANAKNISA